MTVLNRHLLTMATRLPAPRARMVVGAIVAGQSATLTSQLSERAAAAFERDMQGVRNAIAAALHDGGAEALRGLRAMLPGFLRAMNQAPVFADALLRAMAQEFFAGFQAAIQAGDFARLDETPIVTDALAEFRKREVFETDLSSAELRGFSRELRNRSLFSARTTNAEYLQEVQTVVDDILSGKENMSTGRWRLMKKLKELGYDPATGFPDDLALVPPAEKDSLQDLSSERRIDLVLETNVRMARGYAQHVAGNRPADVAARPAWELIRLYPREVPRGKKIVHGALVDDPGNAWRQRWTDAYAEVNGEGAVENRLVAHKLSPIWAALGDGAGGFTDTLLNPFPPFAFRSGMGWRAVPRAEWEALGAPASNRTESQAGAPGLTPGQREVQRVFKGLSPELQDALRKELGL
jgi:hypothetical protein